MVTECSARKSGREFRDELERREKIQNFSGCRMRVERESKHPSSEHEREAAGELLETKGEDVLIRLDVDLTNTPCESQGLQKECNSTVPGSLARHGMKVPELV